MERYEIHDNGGTPFIVENYPAIKEIEIYDTDNNSRKTVKYQKIFTGDQQNDPIGNTILINTNDLEYIFIGRKIVTFNSMDDIVKFYSPISNNDVPYPYAIDSKNRYYLLIENVIVENYEQENGLGDVYDYYYKNNVIGSYIAGQSKRRTRTINNIKNIFYIQKENENPFQQIYCLYVFNLDEDDYYGDYIMRYEPFPRNLGEMYVKYNSRRSLKVHKTFEEIKKIHEEFGKSRGFIPLKMN